MQPLRTGLIAALLLIPCVATAPPTADSTSGRATRPSEAAADARSGGAHPAHVPGNGERFTAPALPHEPAATLELSARLLDLSGQGASRRALVEIGLFSRRELRGLKLERAADGEPGGRIEVQLPGVSHALPALGARKVQVALDLEEGRVHHLRFFSEGEDHDGATLRATAYLRVDLDPALAPRHVDLEDRDLLEYGPAAGGR